MITPSRKDSGFDRAVLTDCLKAQTSTGNGSSDPYKSKNERIFLVSNDQEIHRNNEENTARSRRSRKLSKTRNRKRVTYDEVFECNGITYVINNGRSGIYVEVLRSMIQQFEICQKKWSRVLVLRFDLHTPINSPTNSAVTEFRKKLVERLKWNYGLKEVGFCWVREQEKAKSQHYHFALFLDGDRVRYPSKIVKMIKELWVAKEQENHVPVISSPFYFVDNQKEKDAAIYRISYLAKVRGKGYRPPQTKDYGCSRLKPV